MGKSVASLNRWENPECTSLDPRARKVSRAVSDRLLHVGELSVKLLNRPDAVAAFLEGGDA